MSRFLARRLLALVPVLVGVSIVVFLILHLVPGDPAEVIAGTGTTGEGIEAIRHQLGLDRPLAEQYVTWAGRLLRGNLGQSLVTQQAVLPQLLYRFGNTLKLAVGGMAFALLVGGAWGIVAAVHRGSMWDHIFTVVALAGLSMPIFWLGLLLMLVFAVQLGLVPATGMGGPATFVLPVATLGLNATALVSRIARSSLLEVLQQPYVRTAWAKGLSQPRVLWRHMLSNAAIPIITVGALQFGYLLGGAVLTETVFVWPGLGRLLVDAIMQRDYPVVQGGILLVALTLIALNVATDLLYALVDPRIRYQ
jgi:ABC-type dipeptide/oligopeptide/nickel transport system permease component